MKAKIEKKNTESKNKETTKKVAVSNKKKVSKTWLAVLANKGNGEILDMRAVLK